MVVWSFYGPDSHTNTGGAASVVYIAMCNSHGPAVLCLCVFFFWYIKVLCQVLGFIF